MPKMPVSKCQQQFNFLIYITWEKYVFECILYHFYQWIILIQDVHTCTLREICARLNLKFSNHKFGKIIAIVISTLKAVLLHSDGSSTVSVYAYLKAI